MLLFFCEMLPPVIIGATVGGGLTLFEVFFRPGNSAKCFWELKCFTEKILRKEGILKREIKFVWWWWYVQRNKVNNVFQQRKSWVCLKKWYVLCKTISEWFHYVILFLNRGSDFSITLNLQAKQICYMKMGHFRLRPIEHYSF